MWYYITRRGSIVHCQASVILLGEGGKEKAYYYHVRRYNYYCGSIKDPALIQDPAFISVIMLVRPTTKRDQVFI